MFPREIWELYYDTEAKDVDICIELDAIGHLHEHRLDELDKHKLTYCSHKTRLETLNKLLCDQLRGRDIIIDISEPWKSDILAKFIRGDTDWDKSKMGIEPANNNDASAEPEDWPGPLIIGGFFLFILVTID